MERVVAITGASAGIGRATALRFARDGASVAICARREDRLKAVASEIEQAGGRALPIVADVTSASDMQMFVDRTVRAYGRLDVAMCNAGYGVYGAIDTIPEDTMRALMEVNYFGTYHLLHAALPILRKQNAGHIIVVSSIVGQRGIPYMGAYSATKFAQVGLAECVRAELHGTPIHLSIVYPISTETEFFGVMTKHSGFATRAAGPKQSADSVANAIVAAIGRPTPEIYPKKIAKGLAVLNAIAPGFTDGLVRRWGRKPI
ncbi:MAG: SDR family NAD(P)-dependent oxidoreductase [Vicinamibacterales bacterium]